MRISGPVPTFVIPCEAIDDADDVPPPFEVDLVAPQKPTAIAGDAVRAAQEIIAASLTTVVPAPPPVVRELAPTPLEIAIQTMLDTVPPEVHAEPPLAPETPETPETHDEPTEATPAPLVDIAPAPSHASHIAGRPVATTAVREPAPLPELSNPSHVHLVVDDGAERVVVTVAVRGNEVHIGMRANNDELAAALARNAGVLDHAMHAKRLDLSTFTAERDLPRERNAPDHREREESTEPFNLEETV